MTDPTTVFCDGIPAVELLRLPAASEASRCHILIVPGNPGSAGFYVPLMRALHSLLNERVHVVALSFPGQETAAPRYGRLSLTETVALVGRVLQSFPSGDRVALVGHSIGSYMALKQVSSGPVFAVFPFLEFDEASRKQRFLRFLANNLWLSRLIMACIRTLMPEPVKHRLAGRASDEAWGFRSALHQVQDIAAVATLSLARTEFKDLKTPLQDALQWGDHVGRLTVLYNPEDQYFPPDHRLRLIEAVGVSSLVELPGLRHTFCTSLAESMVVAQEIARRLQDFAV